MLNIISYRRGWNKYEDDMFTVEVLVRMGDQSVGDGGLVDHLAEILISLAVSNGEV